MDSQEQYEALLTQWGFGPEDYQTTRKVYAFGKKSFQLLIQSLSFLVKKIVKTVHLKSTNRQLGINH